MFLSIQTPIVEWARKVQAGTQSCPDLASAKRDANSSLHATFQEILLKLSSVNESYFDRD